MCFSLVFACLSVHLSGWGLDLRRLAGLPPLPTAPTFPPREWNLEQVWSHILVGSGRQSLSLCLHSDSRVLCVCVYVRGEPVCKCVQGGGHVTGGGVRRGGLLEARSAWGGWLTSGFSVGLWAEILGNQGPQSAPLTVHMLTLDGLQGHRVRVHADEALVTVPTGEPPSKLPDPAGPQTWSQLHLWSLFLAGLLHGLLRAALTAAGRRHLVPRLFRELGRGACAGRAV